VFGGAAIKLVRLSSKVLILRLSAACCQCLEEVGLVVEVGKLETSGRGQQAREPLSGELLRLLRNSEEVITLKLRSPAAAGRRQTNPEKANRQGPRSQQEPARQARS
jgi:hypothetical protein